MPRYHANTSLLLAAVKARLKWAEGAEIKRELDAQVGALLGPKTEADLVKPDKKKVKKVGLANPACMPGCCSQAASSDGRYIR